VYDHELSITIAFHPETSHPLLVRAIEEHPILGLISRDLQLFDYTNVDGLMFPQQQQIIYGDEVVLEDIVVSKIHVNYPLEQGQFDGLAEDQTSTVPSPPKGLPDYNHALVGEYWANLLWEGLYRGSMQNLTVTSPAEDLPGVHRIYFTTNSNMFAQLVLEFEDSVIVFESPHHQTDLVIQ
jgi:hypothetical protein